VTAGDPYRPLLVHVQRPAPGMAAGPMPQTDNSHNDPNDRETPSTPESQDPLLSEHTLTELPDPDVQEILQQPLITFEGQAETSQHTIQSDVPGLADLAATDEQDDIESKEQLQIQSRLNRFQICVEDAFRIHIAWWPLPAPRRKIVCPPEFKKTWWICVGPLFQAP